MVTLIEKLEYIYSGTDNSLFGVFNDGTGQRIANWKQPFPQPTQSELDAITDGDPGFTAWLFNRKKKQYTDAVQSHLDQTAAARGYDNIFTCVSYKGDDDPTFNAEGTEAKRWRSVVWKYCHGVLADVESDKVEPQTVEELIEQLPVINWPV